MQYEMRVDGGSAPAYTAPLAGWTPLQARNNGHSSYAATTSVAIHAPEDFNRSTLVALFWAS